MKNIVEYRKNPGKDSDSRNLRFKWAQKCKQIFTCKLVWFSQSSRKEKVGPAWAKFGEKNKQTKRIEFENSIKLH